MTVTKRPNFLIIVADDLGFSDTKPYGSEIETPVLDRLSKDGIRLTNFHTAQACSPTRSMLFSGTDNHIAGLGQMAEAAHMKRRVTGKDPSYVGKPGYEGYLNWKVAALPEILSDAGYLTIMSGKWHLGMTPDVSPSARGFKKSFGFLPGCGNHFNYEPQFDQTEDTMLLTSDGFWMENEKKIDRKKDLPANFYSTNFFTEKFIDILANRTEAEKQQPFFSYLAYTAPHWPMQAPEEVIEKYRGKYDKGPDRLRLDRLEQLKKLGLVPSDIEAAPPVGFESGVKWDDLTDHERAISARKMEVYAAMVDLLDQNIGRVIDALEASGELDNTFILFMSDNGAEGSTLEAAPLLSSFKTLGELIAAYYDNSLENIGKHDSYVWYGSRWACAATAPSRGFKGWSTEGGIRCPCVVRFPPLRTTPDAISHSFTTVMDILPTVLELAQVQHPGASFRGRSVVIPRGKSWINHLASPSENPTVHEDENHIHGWELFGNRAIRKGNWKAVLLARQGGDSWELYNVEEDPAEQHDLAKSRPEILEEMLVHWATKSRSFGTLVQTTSASPLQRIAPCPTYQLAAEDRELLGHWHRVAYKAIAHERGCEGLWQHEVTRLALDHPVILNLALAYSSFEQAHTAHRSQTDVQAHRRRRNICAARGFRYYDAAVGLMRSTVAVASRRNGAICHLASILMMLSSYAEGAVKELIRDRNKPPSMLNDLLVTCRLTRGVRAIAESFGVIWPNRSELILFVTEAEVPAHGPLDPVLELLESLTFLEEEGNAAVRRVCQTALDLMKWLVGKAQTSEWWPAHRASLQWAALVSEEFMQLLEAKEPAALVLLSYGCFLADDDCGHSFVLTGWKGGVCAEIRALVGPRWAWAVSS
ncbi:Alkaline phosphatase-like protein [Beauveria bassiana ARSEF 2860]|uniref:Alkaline phosphatase-like protein n=1 Tax=Beauveria bassiana (strain ARSEF 2860) TaxID=655819 RepID=J4KKQ8_BEAB2|nr:Alkaline phosphatase-like protein [Beauveria bassiana ARSEF 2860]EJP60879.1 Alkaline phosphatase-like protein [Beauveria bassiana ARSEF 2860]